jgi:hypothetical protein
MADAGAQADIRGIDIDKLAKGFADETLVLKKYVTISKTSAREIRWYTKTAGFLDSVDTTGITASQIANTSSKSLAPVVEQSWTRTSSYVRKYFVESPFFSIEDLKDTDIDILATNVRDLVQAVANQVDVRILAVLGDTLGTGGNASTAAATGTGWDDIAAGNPITDLLTAKENIRTNRYNPEGAILYIHPGDHHSLLNFLINVKGSSIPNFASEKVKDGVVMELLGLRVIVSVNASEDTAIVFVPKRACTWKQFTPLTSAVIDDPGIGKKIRVWEEGEAILTDPKAVSVITDVKT